MDNKNIPNDDSYLDKWYEESFTIRAKNIILIDENNNEFILSIENSKLKINPVKKLK